MYACCLWLQCDTEVRDSSYDAEEQTQGNPAPSGIHITAHSQPLLTTHQHTDAHNMAYVHCLHAMALYILEWYGSCFLKK